MSYTNRQGQTLIALLIFIMVALTVTLAATSVAILNIQANNNLNSGKMALQNAQTGADNALLKLERNINYTGETMTLTDGTATITVSGTGTKTIVSSGVSNSFRRTVTVTATNSSNVITLRTWAETP